MFRNSATVTFHDLHMSERFVPVPRIARWIRNTLRKRKSDSNIIRIFEKSYPFGQTRQHLTRRIIRISSDNKIISKRFLSDLLSVRFQNENVARSGQGLFISRYTLFRSRREFAKFAEFSSNGSRKRPFRGLPLWTNSAHGRSMRVTQRVNCRFVTRKAVQPTEDAISNTNAPFMRPPRCLRANCLVSSIFHLPRVSSGKAFDLFNPEPRPFFFFFSSPTVILRETSGEISLVRGNFGELSKKIIIHHEWKGQGLMGFDIRFTAGYIWVISRVPIYRHTWWNFITSDRRVWTRGERFDRGARSSFQCNNLISYSLAARNDFEEKTCSCPEACRY